MTTGLAQPLSRRENNKRTKQMALFDSAMILFARASYQGISVDEICIHDVCRLCRLTGTHLTQGIWCSSRLQPGQGKTGSV